MGNVVIYSTGSCPYCIRAKHLLQSKKIPFTDLQVVQKAHLRAEMIQRSQGRSSVPHSLSANNISAAAMNYMLWKRSANWSRC